MGLEPGQVSAAIVTRGDVDLAQIVESLPFDEVIVWDNSIEPDLGVYGRYAAIDRAKCDVIYVQDDDCVIPAHAINHLLDMYEPGLVTANMPHSRWDDYPDSCLIGWGAVFDRGLPADAFVRLLESWTVEGPVGFRREWFRRTCDVAFTTLTPHRKVAAGFRHLPWAEREYRMFRQPSHKAERDRMLELARQVRDQVAA
jgi:hypothetical protein